MSCSATIDTPAISRCDRCGCGHYICAHCKQRRTIFPDENEARNVAILNDRKDRLETESPICDLCWGAFKERTKWKPHVILPKS